MRKTVIFAEPFLPEIRIQRLNPEKYTRLRLELLSFFHLNLTYT